MLDTDIFGIHHYNLDNACAHLENSQFKNLKNEFDNENESEKKSRCRPNTICNSGWGFFSISSESMPGYQLFCRLKEADLQIENVSAFLNILKDTADDKKIHIICLNRENIAGALHIESALFHAARSWLNDKSISNSFEMEVLLYASGTRQCSSAANFGLKAGKNKLFVCLCKIEKSTDVKTETEISAIFKYEDQAFDDISRKIQETLPFESSSFKGFSNCIDKDTTVTGKLSQKSGNIKNPKINRLMKLFNITKEEIEAAGEDKFEELILEKVALLDVLK